MPLNTTKSKLLKLNLQLIIEANYMRKMTLNDDVISAIEKTLLNSPASYLYFETLIKTLLASAGL